MNSLFFYIPWKSYVLIIFWVKFFYSDRHFDLTFECCHLKFLPFISSRGLGLPGFKKAPISSSFAFVASASFFVFFPLLSLKFWKYLVHSVHVVVWSHMSQSMAVKSSFSWAVVSKVVGAFEVPAPFFALPFFSFSVLVIAEMACIILHFFWLFCFQIHIYTFWVHDF